MTDFQAMSDSEINRWAAERDGWHFHYRGRIEQFTKNEFTRYQPLAYAQSADAALALLERWGFEWTKEQAWDEANDSVRMDVCVWKHGVNGSERVCPITDTCKFPRGALNAACAAKEAQDGIQ